MASSPKKRAPRAAKNLKPTDLRAKMLQEAKDKSTKGTLKEMRDKAKAQAKSKKVSPAKDMNKGGARAKFLRDAKAGNIKAKAPMVSGSSVARGLVKGVLKRAIPVVGFMADASPAQAPAPAQGEKLMRGMPSVGFGGPTSSAAYGYSGRKMKGASVSAKKNIVGNNPNRGLADRKAKAMGTGSAPPGGPPSGKRMKKNNGAFTLGTGAQTTGVATGTASSKPVAPKPRLRPMASAKKEMTFQQAVRRNVTEEYTRKKMRPKGSLLGLLRKR